MCIVSLNLYIFCLLVVLAKLSVLSEPPLCDKEIISTKPRLKSIYDFRFSVLFHCFIVFVLSPALRYSLFVLKVPLNTNQPTVSIPTNSILICRVPDIPILVQLPSCYDIILSHIVRHVISCTLAVLLVLYIAAKPCFEK